MKQQFNVLQFIITFSRVQTSCKSNTSLSQLSHVETENIFRSFLFRQLEKFKFDYHPPPVSDIIHWLVKSIPFPANRCSTLNIEIPTALLLDSVPHSHVVWWVAHCFSVNRMNASCSVPRLHRLHLISKSNICMINSLALAVGKPGA